MHMRLDRFLSIFVPQQDGDATSLESRWSCKPALGAAGSLCSITYSLADTLTLDALNIGEKNTTYFKNYLFVYPGYWTAV